MTMAAETISGCMCLSKCRQTYLLRQIIGESHNEVVQLRFRTRGESFHGRSATASLLWRVPNHSSTAIRTLELVVKYHKTLQGRALIQCLGFFGNALQ